MLMLSSSSSQETWQRRHGGPFPEPPPYHVKRLDPWVVGVVLGKTPDVPMEKMFDDGGFLWRLGAIQSAISRQHLDDDIPPTYPPRGWMMEETFALLWFHACDAEWEKGG